MAKIPLLPKPEPDHPHYTVGSGVRHGIWGNGKVSAVNGDRCLVVFDNGESRSILSSFLRNPPIAANDDIPADLRHVSPKVAQRVMSYRREHEVETDAQPTAPQQQKASGITVVDPSDWQGDEIPDRPWYLKGLLPGRTVTLMSGDGGTGKSLVALQIAIAGALGVETLGLNPEDGGVVYLAAEDEEDELKRRMADILHAHGRQFSDLAGRLKLIPMAGKDAALGRPDKSKNIQPTAAMADLAKLITEFQPRLLVLDTSADLFDGDEINRVQVRQFVGMLRSIAMAGDMAVLLLSHPSVQGMQSGSGISGSTAWNNSVRSRMYLTADKDDDDGRTLTVVKANYGKKGDEIKMRWRDGLFALNDGRPSPGSAMLAAQAERVFRDAISAMNRNGERVAKTKGINYAPKIISERPEAKGLSVKTLEAAMHQLFADEELRIVIEGPPSKPRQRIILASEDFGPK